MTRTAMRSVCKRTLCHILDAWRFKPLLSARGSHYYTRESIYTRIYPFSSSLKLSFCSCRTILITLAFHLTKQPWLICYSQRNLRCTVCLPTCIMLCSCLCQQMQHFCTLQNIFINIIYKHRDICHGIHMQLMCVCVHSVVWCAPMLCSNIGYVAGSTFE